MKHKVQINIKKGNKKQMLYADRVISLPKRIVRLLFGEATQILIMQPGQSIKTVEFFELPDGGVSKHEEGHYFT